MGNYFEMQSSFWCEWIGVFVRIRRSFSVNLYRKTYTFVLEHDLQSFQVYIKRTFAMEWGIHSNLPHKRR